MTAAAAVLDGDARSRERDRTLGELLAPACAFLAATGIALWAIGPYMVGVFHDDGVYLTLAQSVANGHGLRYGHLPGNPAAVHYPPLYPLVLSVLLRLMSEIPQNTGILARANAIFLGAGTVGWWYFATAQLEWSRGKAAVASVASNVMLPTLALASALLSETLFLALLWPALLFCERAINERRVVALLRAGVAIGMLMLVRTHAVALLGALVLVLATARRWRDVTIALGAAVVIQLPWILWSATASPRVASSLEGSYGSYIGWFLSGVREGGISFVAATVGTNTHESWLYLGDRLAAGFPTPLHKLTVLLALVAVIIGCIALARRTPVTVVFFALYLLITLAWPFNPWRFLWAVWPVALLLGLSGVLFLWQQLPKARPIFALPAALVGFALLRVELHSYADRGWHASSRAAALQIAPVIRWLKTNVEPSEMILTEGEPAVAIQSHRRAAPPMSFTAREYLSPPNAAQGAVRLGEMLHAVPSKVVILMSPSAIAAAETMRFAHPGLERVATLPTAVAYRVTP